MFRKNFFPVLHIVVLLFIILPFKVNSQPKTWFKTYGIPDRSESGKKILQCYDGNYVVIGSRYEWQAGTFDECHIMKFDIKGNLVWDKLVGDSVARRPYDLIQTRDSGFVILGTSYGVFIAKTDKDGNFKWQKNFSELPPYSLLADIKQTKDNGFILCGAYTDYVNPSAKALALKTDSLGNVQWKREYMDSLFNGMGEIIPAGGGEYYVSGFTQKLHPNVVYCSVKKLKSDGNIIWSRIYGQDIAGHFMIMGNDGNLIIVTDNASTYGSPYPVLLKLDTLGNLFWIKSFSSPYFLYGNIKDYDGNIVLTTGYAPTGTIGLWKLNTEGDLLKRINLNYNGFRDIGGVSVDITSDFGYVLTGSAAQNNFYDLLIVKTDSAFDAPIISSISGFESYSPEKFTLYQNYPNPFNSSTTIRFVLPQNGNTEVYVFDMTGKIIFSKMKYFYQGTNEYKIDFGLLNLSSGVYFVKLNFGFLSEVVSCVYLK